MLMWIVTKLTERISHTVSVVLVLVTHLKTLSLVFVDAVLRQYKSLSLSQTFFFSKQLFVSLTNSILNCFHFFVFIKHFFYITLLSAVMLDKCDIEE
jgi:hypothetical protein